MTWREAVNQSNDGIGIRYDKKLEYDVTYLVNENRQVLSHAFNNPMCTILDRNFCPDGYDDWLPAECLGPIFPNEVETGIIEPKAEPGHDAVNRYRRDAVEKEITLFDEEGEIR